MKITTIRNEKRRGCGYRQQGGTYLVSSGEGRDCGKLPLKLTVCPCCGQGVKPARGFTWIDGDLLFKDVECVYDAEGLAGSFEYCHGGAKNNPCPLSVAKIGQLGVLWIGEKFYKDPGTFNAEAAMQGICRRIPAIPKQLVVGETWIALAHRKGFAMPCAHPKIEREGSYLTAEEVKDCPDCDDEGFHYERAIFRMFRPQRIEYVVKPDDSEKKLESLEKRGVTLVKLVWDQDNDGNGLLGGEQDRPIEESEKVSWRANEPTNTQAPEESPFEFEKVPADERMLSGPDDNGIGSTF